MSQMLNNFIPQQVRISYVTGLLIEGYMKFAKIMHNPVAGDNILTKKELVSMIQSVGIECSYSSTKQGGWKKIKANATDFLVLAGGDGTIHQVAAALLRKKLLSRKLPIAVLPLGTANNIARSLGVKGDIAEIMETWNTAHVKKFDA
ncbi:MAG: diacylglycerol/lipid kinase family protein, partial [Bacteroidota bacterium]